MKTLQFFLFFFFLNFSLSAQTINPDLMSYPEGVIAEVVDLTYKGDVSQETQRGLADIIVARNQALLNVLNNGGGSTQYYEVSRTFEDQLYGMLTTDQKYKIYVAKVRENARHKFTYSQFAIALRYKDSLDINPSQEEWLLSQVGTLKAMKNSHYESTGKSLDTRAYESAAMTENLTLSQYTSLLIIKNQSKAESYANRDWDELVQRGLTEYRDETITKAELVNYYLARQVLYDRFQHDLVQQKIETRAIYPHRPYALKLLQKARRSPQNDTLDENFNGG